MGKLANHLGFGSHDADESFASGGQGLFCGSMELKTRHLYYLGFALVTVNRLVSSCASNLSISFLALVPWMPLALFLLLVRCTGIVFDKGLCVRQRAAIVVVFALSIVSYLRSGQSYLPSAILLICGIGRIDIRRAVKTAALAVLLLAGLLGLLQLFVWLLTGSLPGAVLRSNGRVRLSFFFSHPNVLAAVVCMSFMGLSATWERLSIKTASIGAALGLLALIVTDSKTSVAILVFYLVLRGVLENCHPSFGKVLAVFYAAVPVLLFLFAALVMRQALPDQIYKFFNSLFTGRPGFWILQYEQIGGWTFFGQQALYGNQMIDGYLHVAVTIDSFYAATLLQLGAWSFFVYYFMYIKAGIRAFSRRDCCMIAVLLACALFGATEIHMIDLAICTPMLLLGEGLLFSDAEDDTAPGELEADTGGLS